jgi:hypothetical protein
MPAYAGRRAGKGSGRRRAADVRNVCSRHRAARPRQCKFYPVEMTSAMLGGSGTPLPPSIRIVEAAFPAALCSTCSSFRGVCAQKSGRNNPPRFRPWQLAGEMIAREHTTRTGVGAVRCGRPEAACASGNPMRGALLADQRGLRSMSRSVRNAGPLAPKGSAAIKSAGFLEESRQRARCLFSRPLWAITPAMRLSCPLACRTEGSSASRSSGRLARSWGQARPGQPCRRPCPPAAGAPWPGQAGEPVRLMSSRRRSRSMTASAKFCAVESLDAITAE